MKVTQRLQNDFGVYLHIPYCKSRCPYCDFNIEVNKAPPWPQLVDALLHELKTRASLFDSSVQHGLGSRSKCVSIYFGGGTPSLMPVPHITTLIYGIKELFYVAQNAEITVEVEPETVDQHDVEALLKAGVNRVSIGWQSSEDRLLKVLGRSHTVHSAAEMVALCRDAGVSNVSLDLIYAVPGQSLTDLERTLKKLIHLQPQHISTYSLTYYPGTSFYKRREKGKLLPVSHDIEAEMMGCIEESLSTAGYEHYEVSAYAKNGQRAVHNALYWQGARYLGVGPGAHSFWHGLKPIANEMYEEMGKEKGEEKAQYSVKYGKRWEGIKRPDDYIEYWSGAAKEAFGEQVEGGESLSSVESREELNAKSLRSERVMCALRTTDGITITELLDNGVDLKKQEGDSILHSECLAQIKTAIAHGWAVVVNDEGYDRLVPTSLGMRYADSLAELFF